MLVSVLYSSESMIDFLVLSVFFFQAEDGIRYLVRSRGLGDVYKRQRYFSGTLAAMPRSRSATRSGNSPLLMKTSAPADSCLLYTSDAADERSSVDLGGRRIIKKTTTTNS